MPAHRPGLAAERVESARAGRPTNASQPVRACRPTGSGRALAATIAPSAKCGRSLAGRVTRFFASSFWTDSPSSNGYGSPIPPHITPLLTTLQRRGTTFAVETDPTRMPADAGAPTSAWRKILTRTPAFAGCSRVVKSARHAEPAPAAAPAPARPGPGRGRAGRTRGRARHPGHRRRRLDRRPSARRPTRGRAAAEQPVRAGGRGGRTPTTAPSPQLSASGGGSPPTRSRLKIAKPTSRRPGPSSPGSSWRRTRATTTRAGDVRARRPVVLGPREPASTS